jgi:hypothetical protein
MATIYKYRVYCQTDSTYEYVWNETEPTKCPENTSHTIDSTITTIVEERVQDVVTVKEEDVPTGGRFKCETIKVSASGGTTGHCYFFRERPITALLLRFSTADEHKGDIVKMYTGEDSVAGVITSSAIANSSINTWVAQSYVVGDKVKYTPTNPLFGERIYTCIADADSSKLPTNVSYWKRGYELSCSSTVAPNSDGLHLKLFNGVNKDNLGQVLSVDKVSNKVYTQYAPTNSFNAGTYVLIQAQNVEDYEIGEGQVHKIGEGKIGGSYVPADTVVHIMYVNNSAPGTPLKTIIGSVEYLT